MAQITLRIDDELLDELDAEADDRGVSRSQFIRDTLATRGRVEELERELEQTEARVEDLRRQLQQANSRERDVDELVAYVEEERELQHRREEREQRREQRERDRRNASAWRRAKWWLFGTPEDDPTD